MILKLKSIVAVVDCCVGIDAYFTDLQRSVVIDATTIAGLHPLCLLHETTAPALTYGIYRLILTGLFGEKLRHTLNANECVFHGCTLQCEILSPNFKSSGVSSA